MTSLHLQRVEALIAECGFIEPPINIYQLIWNCGREIYFANLSGDHQGTCLSFSQAINNIIVLNTNLDCNWKRRRFTAAHELNHSLFHQGYSVETSSSRTIRRLERESNSFASLILVPNNLLHNLDEAYGFLSIRMISEIFGISKEAAKYRLFSYRNLDFGDRDSRRKIESREKRLYQDFQYTEIPDSLFSWKALRSIIYGPCMSPFCLRCGCVKLDEYPEVCWGCGKDTEKFIGNIPKVDNLDKAKILL